jgi:Protein of unknown function (DUF551)
MNFYLNFKIKSMNITDEEIIKLADWWQKEYEKLAGYWFDKEQPNKERMEFILDHRRKFKEYALQFKSVPISSNGWINFPENKPIYGQEYNVLVKPSFSNKEWITTMMWNNTEWLFCGQIYEFQDKVTHWQPLPTSPNK